MNRYEELKVYQRSIDFVVEVYRFGKSLPDEEKFGLINQIRRAATSIPLNIAEGSSYETKTVLTICQRLDYGNKKLMDKLLQELDEIIAILKGLIRSIK